ncbi:hypothetical protein BGZ95_002546 [Linnemannia exigua]|uniref:Uncharacterized protein n=1 Tax=Linnemannia exigua TaxID=604196 RepID=A0AAD4H2W2_9FUNG|nr:hypothetical protein BGZ95_002546 [Linnemannia exigua]
MKITLTLLALVVMATTAVSATPVNSTISIRAAPCTSITLNWRRDLRYTFLNPDPVNDLHSFQLTVRERYYDDMPRRPTAGTKKNNYRETRKSSDGLWSVEHDDNSDFYGVITLIAKKQKFVFRQANSAWGDKNTIINSYWQCVNW